MVTAFERIIIDVPDLAIAVRDYSLLTGLQAAPAMCAVQREGAWFGFGNTVVQLQQADCSASMLSTLVFSHGDAESASGAVANTLSLDLRLSTRAGPSTADGRPLPVGELSVDHLVLRTGDAQACLDLFRDRLGIRLALDRTVPEWGGRMLFFRAGKLTLEVIAADDVTRTGFWGIAYQCADIAATRRRLLDSGVSVTGVREGRKPGTRVATVKSHCLDIPTLLIGPVT